MVDLRCLQDVNYRDRGIGRLVGNLLRSARKFLSRPDAFNIIGLIDDNLPPLEERFSSFVDEVRPVGYIGGLGRGDWFVEMSPMTHDPLFVARITDTKDIFKASIVYDFIPMLMPDKYLPTPVSRINYNLGLFWLGCYDHFFPISQYAARELTRILGIDASRISVTAPPIEDAFFHAGREAQPASADYVLVAGGGDVRKNVEIGLRAHAKSSAAQAKRTRLVVTGNYPEAWRASLQQIYANSGGAPDLLSFSTFLSDAALASLYRNAACVVVPSRAEGFSIPVVEAMAAGAPAFTSAIPAHEELVGNPDFMFDVDDDRKLITLLDRVLLEPGFRQQVIDQQSNRSLDFEAVEIALSFWQTLEHYSPAQPASPLVGGQRPQIAVLTPLPPDRSGVADYTAASLKEFGRFADIHVFTPTVSPKLIKGVVSIQPISAIAHLTRRYDRVVSVVGNSHFHLNIFDNLMRYGGACIEHDNRLLGFYSHYLGDRRMRSVAESELKRPLEPGEIERWLSDESTLEATHLGEIARVSDPLCVHSKGTARLVKERFGVNAVHLPFSIYREWPASHLDPASRAAARQRLNIPPDEIAIVTLGFVYKGKAPDDCIWALEMLRGWGIAAKLYFVGAINDDLSRLARLCKDLGVDSNVIFISEYTSEDTYRDYLLAADIAIQLRTHLLGGLSGALLDCIAVGLPTVANDDLAESMEAPSYVVRVSDRPSPVLIAEGLAVAAEIHRGRQHVDEERAEFYAKHNFRIYAEQLCAALSLDLRVSTSD